MGGESSAPEQDSAGSSDAGAPAPGPIEILVVDDEEVVRFVVAETLRRQGWIVHEAADGATALELLEVAVTAPDVMVFDLRMPTMDGSQLFARVRDRWPGVACVLMSGIGADEQVDELYRAGVNAVLPKPFSAEALVTTIASVVARRHA